MFFVALATVLSSASPVIFKFIVDGVARTSDPDAQAQVLTLWGTLYVASLALMWVCWRLSGFIGMRWVVGAGITGYERLYAYTTAHSHGYFINRFAGTVANKISHVSEGSSRLCENFMWGYFDSILRLIIAVGLMCYANVWMGLVFLFLVISIVAINIPLLKYRRPYVVSYAETFSAFKGFGIDILSNIATVRQYVFRNNELKGIKTALARVRREDLNQWELGEWALTINNALIVVFLSAIMIILLQLFNAGVVSAGDMILVFTLLYSSSHTLTFIGNAMASAVRVYGEVEEGLVSVLEPYEISDMPGAEALQVREGSVEWSNVDFQFGENAVFENFNLTIQPGERVGLVGPSGAGKSTFVSLLLRQHDIDSGAITIDGQNIAEVTQDSLRKNIAVVPQEPLLFHRTIKENIAYGKPNATNKEIEAVAQKAEAHDFIAALPDRYNTLVGERGVKLSGGQRQRIAIARAMLKEAPILVLDEATSALDSESEVAIQKALHELMEGKTVVAIAHRLSTLREMDRIIVLENGSIVEDGSHSELIHANGVYARLWTHQAGGFLQE